LRWPEIHLVRLLLLAGCLMGAAAPVFAQQKNPALKGVYASLNVALGGVRHSSVDFNPGFASIAAGAWLWPGIGLEVFLDKGLGAGSDGDFELEITGASGIAARFQSPPSGGIFAYMLLGVVSTRLEQLEDDTRGARRVVQNYRGGRVSIGLGRELRMIPGGRLTAEYRNYFVDDDLQIDALSMGLQVNFQ